MVRLWQRRLLPPNDEPGMPKITSLGASKETIVPLSSRAKKPKAVGGDDDADDVVGLSKARRAKGGSSSRQAGATREPGREMAGAGTSSSSDPAPSRRQRDAYELQKKEDEEGLSEQERVLADRVAMVSARARKRFVALCSSESGLRS